MAKLYGRGLDTFYPRRACNSSKEGERVYIVRDSGVKGGRVKEKGCIYIVRDSEGEGGRVKEKGCI